MQTCSLDALNNDQELRAVRLTRAEFWSTPMAGLPRDMAAARSVPVPQNSDKTVAPGLQYSRTKYREAAMDLCCGFLLVATL